MENKFDEILSFLKELGVEKISKNEKKALLQKFNETHNINQLKGELDLLFAINQSLVSRYSSVSINNMLELYKSIDKKLMVYLSTMYEAMRMKSKNEFDALKRFREIVRQTLKSNEETNNEIGKILDETMKKSLMLKDSLYLTMRSKEQADELFTNCITRSKLFIKQCESNNLETIIYCLKKDFKFSDEEIVNISKKCASFFVSSSVSKINNLYEQIENFKKFIKNQSTLMSNAIEINKLLDKEFKDILFDSSSVATLNPNAINKTLRFLSGEKLGDIVFTNKKISEIKGDFSPIQLAKIYNQSISSISSSVEKIADVCYNIDEVYKNIFGAELNLNKLINGNNFSSISQLTKEDYLNEGKINEIFKILSMFISAEDMENLLRNNLSFLIAPIEAVKLSLQAAVLNSADNDQLKKNVLQKIRNHFDIYEGGFKNIVMENKTPTYSSLNKVRMKNIEEDELKEILVKLKTSNKDIEEWSKNFNKEKKESRDLAIQLDLEALDKNVEGLKDFLNINFESLEQFEEEVQIIKNMFNEIDKQYSDIVTTKRLNKSLSSLANSINKKLEVVKDEINSKIQLIISLYNEELTNLNNKLGECNNSLSTFLKNQKLVNELDDLIKEKQINIEELEEKKESYKELKKFITSTDSIIKKCASKDKLISKLIPEYYSFLKRENTKTFLNSTFMDATNTMKFKDIIGIKFFTFIRSLELEEFIVEIDIPVNLNVQDLPYSQYRNTISKEAQKLTDKIYNLCVENRNNKINLRNQVLNYVKNFNLDINDELDYHEKVNKLVDFLEELEIEVEENTKIIEKRKKYNKESIAESLEALEKEKKQLETSIQRYTEKISEHLTIKR